MESPAIGAFHRFRQAYPPPSAAYRAGPHLFAQLGATVVTIANTPDGLNINHECGATHTDALKAKVKEVGADLGVALDGDADRVILVDENGDDLNGDQILAVLAEDLPDGAGVVSTQMANLALERYLQSHGRKLVRTAVGDRYVVEGMKEHAIALGGEPSGHILFGGATAVSSRANIPSI